ncbi:MAG: acyl carrier protein [Planctomycetaceae bacterium]|mgnify:FL=1|nr:acyl carrier protein [Planctomycetaceae bacterium]
MAGDVRERVIKVVAETLNLEAGQIHDESKFVEDLGAESMQSVELIAAFEEEFDIEMDEEEALDVKTVGKAVDFIAAHLD